MPPITRAQWVAYYVHGMPIPQLGPSGSPGGAAGPALTPDQQAQQDALVARGINAIRQHS